jgi:glycosyltransferase involved in cell wall biosynthesis
LHEEIMAVVRERRYDCEIIFVNDGSTDGTRTALLGLRHVTLVDLRKNYGQTAAMDAGIRAAQGDTIVTMDGDGQNDPADIPRLLEELHKGYDVVSGWRISRRDPFLKRFISRGAHVLRGFFVKDGIHDSGCTLKAYRRECFENLDLYGELHRFVPGLLRWQGFRVTEVPVNHRPRHAGKTKYTLKRTLYGFLDMLGIWFWRKFSARPLHLFGGVGLLLGTTGALLIAVLFVLRLFDVISLAESIWPLTGFFLMLGGALLITSGLMADIMIKNYHRIHEIRPYNVREIIRR